MCINIGDLGRRTPPTQLLWDLCCFLNCDVLMTSRYEGLLHCYTCLSLRLTQLLHQLCKRYRHIWSRVTCPNLDMTPVPDSMLADTQWHILLHQMQTPLHKATPPMDSNVTCFSKMDREQSDSTLPTSMEIIYAPPIYEFIASIVVKVFSLMRFTSSC